MKCSYHPAVESQESCIICKKLLCNACTHTIKGKAYCEDCLVRGAEWALTIKDLRLPTDAPKRAALCALIPGLGAVYNSEYMKAITYFAVWSALAALGSRVSSIFGFGAFVFLIFTMFDAYRIAEAKLRNRLESHGTSKEAVEEFPSQEKIFIAAVNPEKIYKAHEDEAIRKLLTKAEFLICDGIGTAIAAKILHGRSVPRITGISLFMELIKAAAKDGHSIYLLGWSEESNRLARDNLNATYADLKIVGSHHGYFSDSDEIVREINEKHPDLLFVALGSPKQEIWISENRDRLSVPICMGIGGTLDVVGGAVKWAPAIFRKTGTEWLYRLLSEPKRWKRQLALPKFLVLLLKYKVGFVK